MIHWSSLVSGVTPKHLEAVALLRNMSGDSKHYRLNIKGYKCCAEKLNDGFLKKYTGNTQGETKDKLIGPSATDMISKICIAMKLDATIDEIAATIHPHPTVSEIIVEAAHDTKGV